MYRYFIRPFLFALPPETAHWVVMELLRISVLVPGVKRLLKKAFSPETRPVRIGNLEFLNPVGLAAGFDKNARYVEVAEALGFGFVEVGTVTPEPQPGNPKPRLFRLIADEALINRMGFNNDGARAVASRLKRTRRSIPLGVNIGKNKYTPTEEAWKDYVKCFEILHPYADFIVINVSSPNTPGLRSLQSVEHLTKILQAVQRVNHHLARPLPVWVKLSPDLRESELREILKVCAHLKVKGIVATNTTVRREGLKTPPNRIRKIGRGGLSGRPLHKQSVHVVELLRETAGADMYIIGAGGIMKGEDALKFKEKGASLVEIFTGLIYGGPRLIRDIACQWDQNTN